nr:carboxymuconolactone decarboxylase family protein [Kibdelosporangium sp. MJ126-NF4]CEL14253.1 alkylhydroperoxidase like protein, AhpD family [Kibdelosporangium sp. MJ126-NF4]CTQ88620.1 alkylhydroperoxidase like protein, AhpD family [Kibdelosporangium sp. MJ126-NF4]
MGGILLKAALRKSLGKSLSGIHHLSPDPRAGGTVASVRRQVESDFGLLAPPIALHSPAPDVMAACWVMLREALVVTDRVDRDTKEAVATAVSLCNACSYCVDVHSMTLEAFGEGAPDDPENDLRVRGFADWARRTACATTTPCCPPYPASQVPELIGVVFAFHYVNRMVNVFLPDSPLPRMVPTAARGTALRMLGKLMRSATRGPHDPGASLHLLPTATLPTDLAWAQDNSRVADAFARATSAIDAAGARSVPDSVRALLTRMLADWIGDPPGLSRTWVTDAVAELPSADRPAGELALITALASFQLDTPTIDRFRKTRPDDRSLVELTAWASMAAARRIGSWIGVGQCSHGKCTDNSVET